MDSVEEILGFDPDSGDARRAQLLAANDRALLRELVKIRKERGISQGTVGKMLGISQPSVAAFESHDANPKLSTVRRYAHAVGALVSHAVGRDEGQLSSPSAAHGWRTARLDFIVRQSGMQGAVLPLSTGAGLSAESTRGNFTLAS